MMADETTPAPLSDAEIVVVAHLAGIASEARSEVTFAPGAPILLMDAWSNVRRLLATLAARDAEVERLKSQVAYHETMRQDAEFRYEREHEDRARDYNDASATLAAYREIVAAVVVDNGPLVQDRDYLYYDCGYCEGDASQWPAGIEARERSDFIHAAACPVTRARALLGTTEGTNQ